MIYPTFYYTAICDNCKIEYSDTDSEFGSMSDEAEMQLVIEEEGWHIEKATPYNPEKSYCPDCYFIDDDDQVKVKELRKDIYLKNKFYIQRKGAYLGNALMWWKKNKRGFTPDLNQALKVDLEEAISIVKNKDRDVAYQCVYIDTLSQGKQIIIDSQFVDSAKQLF